jgi:membrane fusion protein (multidrug efflux system)
MLRTTACLIALAAGLAVGRAAPAQAQQQGDAAAVAVGTAPAERRAIAQSLDVVGRIEATNRVDVRARVTGYLEAVEFKEGEVVAEGALLYRIEPDLFEAAVKQAEGALDRSRAAQQLAEIQLKRAQELLERNAGTAVARDQARAQEEAARGAVTTDEANLQTAKINLGYTAITSPIAGRIGRTSVTKGNVVGPDSGVLTTIVSQDPIYVLFPISQRELLRRNEGNSGDASTIKVRLQFSDGTVYREIGKIDFINISVDRTTDTVQVRAVMPNPGNTLRDGQLVRVLLESGTPEEKVVVPQSALIADQGGVYVFLVEDGKAVTRRIKTGGESGADVIVDSGLSGGEQVIVDGLQRVRPGSAVRAAPVQRPAGKI